MRGDTIVEVMMAIVILSGVLGGTFAVASRAQRSTQANHERYQAQLYANQQAEWIKQASAADRSAFVSKFTSDKVFCMTDVSTVQMDETNAACKKDNLFTVTVTASQNCNYIKTGCSKNTYDDFYVRVTWSSLVNNTGDEIGLIYGI